MKAELSGEDLESLRQQLEWHRLPAYAKTSYGKETAAMRARRQAKAADKPGASQKGRWQ